MKVHMNSQRSCKQTSLNNEAGFTLPTVLSFIIAMAIITTTAMMVVMNNLTSSGIIIGRQQSLHIAEAGINYYLWHMAHNPTDYKDGNATPSTPDVNKGYGPYVHDYIDANSQKKGTFTLWIKPSSSGSTVATIRSTAKTNDGVTRTLEARIGAASFASYGLLF
ncbi:type II secretion system protein [Candidatus Saccharibacteria bacterium]|nr:MAG: type II secretion system protein [Candidatus Saccharibacteria bacterium]